MTTSAAKPQSQDTLAFDIAGGPAAGTVTLRPDHPGRDVTPTVAEGR